MHSHTRFFTSGHTFNGFIRIFISRKLNLQLIILTHHTSKMFSSGKKRFHFHRKMETIPPQKHQQTSQTNNTWYRKIQKTRKRKNGKWIRLSKPQTIRLSMPMLHHALCTHPHRQTKGRKKSDLQIHKLQVIMHSQNKKKILQNEIR